MLLLDYFLFLVYFKTTFKTKMDEDYDALNTRAAFYSKIKNDRQQNNATAANINTRTNSICYLKCELHHGTEKWSKDNELCEHCLLFSSAEFPNGKLPTAENVIATSYTCKISQNPRNMLKAGLQ